MTVVPSESDSLSEADDESGSDHDASGLNHARAGSLTELLRVAWPLIVSNGSLTLMTVCDRVFLTWVSTEALAASMPATLMHYTVMSVAFGICGYVNVFVAQHDGAGEPDGVAKALWQGVWIANVGGFLMMFAPLVSGPLLNLTGHEQEVLVLEKAYFDILCMGSLPFLLSLTLSAIFSGRGQTRVVMWIDFAGVLINLVLDYILIFGFGSIPAYGIVGAAWATVISKGIVCLIYIAWIVRDRALEKYALGSHWRFDWERMWRLIRFGTPEGVQALFDILGFTLFLILIGKIGKTEQAATNIAFSINTMVFMPLIGLGRALSTIVGQRVGEGRPKLARRTVTLSLKVAFTGLIVYIAACLAIPEWLILPFRYYADDAEFAAISELVTTLLLFSAAYTLFDGMVVLYGAAIRGAGDTFFSMVFSIAAVWSGLVLPTFGLLYLDVMTIYNCWAVCTVYIVFVGIGFWLRYRTGKWQRMNVLAETK